MMKQDYLVFQDDASRAVARGQIDGEELVSSADAREALQLAIDECAGGGEVELARGVYRLSAPLELRNGVTLRGKGRGSRLVVAEKNEAGVGLLGESVKGITLADLAIVPERLDTGISGVRLRSCGNAELDSLYVAGFKEYGIEIGEESFLSRVSRCMLASNGKANLHMGAQYRGKYGDFIPNLVSDCIVFGGGHGIECARAIVLNIVGCVAYQTGGHGFYVRSNSNSVLISGCRTFQITGCAVKVESSDEFNLSSNVFCWHTENGVHVENTCWGVIAANEFIDSGSWNSGTKDLDTKPEDVSDDVPLYAGVRLSGCKGFNVTGNTLFNWEQALQMSNGIEIEADCEACSVSNNNVNYYRGEAVVASGSNGLEAGNLGVADRPHHPIPPHGRKFVQSFQVERIQEFVKEVFHFQ